PVQDVVAHLSLQKCRKLESLVLKANIKPPGKVRQISPQHHKVFIIDKPIAVLVPKNEVARLQVIFGNGCGIISRLDLLIGIKYPSNFVSKERLIRLPNDRTLPKFSRPGIQVSRPTKAEHLIFKRRKITTYVIGEIFGKLVPPIQIHFKPLVTDFADTTPLVSTKYRWNNTYSEISCITNEVVSFQRQAPIWELCIQAKVILYGGFPLLNKIKCWVQSPANDSCIADSAVIFLQCRSAYCWADSVVTQLPP